jgi:hypothetical protein
MTTPSLLIGGPKDGERLIVEGNYLAVCEAPKWEYGQTDIPQPERHTYRKLRLAHLELFVHQSLTDDQALDRLVKRYRKTYRKRKW